DRERLLADTRREDLDTDLARERRELLDRRRAVDVARDEQWIPAARFLQELRELRRGRRLARALEAREQHDRWRRDREIEVGALAAHQAAELAVHRADERLPRRQARGDLLAQRRLAHPLDELLDH